MKRYSLLVLLGSLLFSTAAPAFQEILSIKKPYARVVCGDNKTDIQPWLFPSYIRFNHPTEIEVSSDPNFMSVDTLVLNANTHRFGAGKLAFVANYSAPNNPFLLTLEGTASLGDNGAITKVSGIFISRYSFSSSSLRGSGIQDSNVVTCFGSGHFATR